ncbi:hypothetical protein CSCA_0743 [Clostridium scatologenes]|uniref:Uncharacterized protein n=1 Tax=Clostridium scatologenes TaxID=1548 RepID=A0A0E3JX80_CLOSL|nr:hypothetical protein CSCA_0743 [Clostridium scatologenes]
MKFNYYDKWRCWKIKGFISKAIFTTTILTGVYILSNSKNLINLGVNFKESK